MFRRLRQSKISLAAKCQLLFGAAVILIISAALWVPWGRMDYLTAQLNERAAQAIVRNTLAEHIFSERQNHWSIPIADRAMRLDFSMWSTLTMDRPMPLKLPTAMPLDSDSYVAPRLLSISAQNAATNTRFENGSINKFLHDPDARFQQRFYLLGDGREGYRYTQPVFARGDCIMCHTGRESTYSNSAFRPTTAAAVTQPRPLIGIVSVDIPSQIDPRQLLLNRVFLLSAGAFAGTLAIVIFWLITTRLILQPVRVLQETAEKVSRGDLNIRSDINTGDEFQQLSETFNVMLVNLKKSADQLRAVNKSLDLKLGQLAESNVTLNESNRLKSEFLANVSHELRTPLNSILGFADLLRDQVPQTAEGKASRYVQNIVSSGNNLLDLINDLLDLAKIEAGKMEVRVDSLSLNDVFEGLSNLLKPLLEPKRISIANQVDPDVPIIRTDATKLQQILYNFLSNAIKFSPADAEIGLAASRFGNDRVRIEVTDRGPGIDPALQSIIFEKFRQLDGSVTRQHSGTGLGLAISKELATLLGGAIGLQSKSGDGATFWIALPLKIESGAQDVRR